MNSCKFIPQKVLNMKKQGNKKLLLIKWQNLSVQKATWQPSDRFQNIEHLIYEYQKSKVNDQQRNFALKHSEKIDCGQNPYEETSRHGHFMYGDQPQSIQSIKVFLNNQDQTQRTTVICQIKWKGRLQINDIDNQQQEVNLILQNSFIDSKIVNQYNPDLLGQFYQRRIRLNTQRD